jgi:excinuclease UvrABC ATPase subunit
VEGQEHPRQILELTVEDALAFFKDVPTIARKLQTLLDVGLSYIRWARAPPRSRAARRSA